MRKRNKRETGANLSAAQEVLLKLWEEHVRHEFTTHHTEDTLATKVDVARNCSNRKARGDPARCNCPIPRWQTGPRTHLLGPRVSSGSTWPPRSEDAPRCRRGECQKSSGQTIAIKCSD